MNRSKQIFLYYSFTDHNRIFKIVTLPWHEGNFEIFTNGQFSILSCITLSEKISLLYLLTFSYGRLEVYRSLLVCFYELGKSINLEVIFKAYKFLIIVSIIPDMNF